MAMLDGVRVIELTTMITGPLAPKPVIDAWMSRGLESRSTSSVRPSRSSTP